jgi:hypothetical protein
MARAKRAHLYNIYTGAKRELDVYGLLSGATKKK